MWKLFKIIGDKAFQMGCSVYLVGGAVRDLILQKEPADLDFAVSHQTLPLAKEVAKQLEGTLVVLDKEREIMRVVLPNYLLDFSPYKGDSIEGDLRARDFTLNAMALAIRDLEPAWHEHLLDPCGGIQDLQQGLLRVTSCRSILEDPLRALRGIRLAARFNLSVLPETGVYLKQGCRRMDSIAGERIWQELANILRMPRSYPWIDYLDRELNFFSGLLPGRLRMQETRQNYYHVENVWNHSLRTFHCLELILQELPLAHPAGGQITNDLNQRIAGARSRLELIKLASLVHDVGKPDTAIVQSNGRISFHGHPEAAMPYVDALAQRLRLAKEELQYLKQLVLYHMEPLALYTGKALTDLSIYRFFKTLGEHASEILLLSLADLTATYTAGERLSELTPYRQFIFNLITIYTQERSKYNPPRWLSGSDLIALGIPEGPAIGMVLEKLSEAQVTGLVKDKSTAVSWVKGEGFPGIIKEMR